MKKMKYVAPAVEQHNVELEGMMALSMQPGNADPGKDVLAPEQNWDIWGSK